MRTGLSRAVLGIVLAGVGTFVVVYALLVAPLPAALAPAAGVTPGPVSAPDSVAPRLPSDDVGVGVPIAGSETLLRDVKPGDRLDVLASVAAPDTGRPLTAVVIRGATVIQPPAGDQPLLLGVPSSDAIVLAHLVLGGTRLGFAVWSGGVPPAKAAPLDEQTARQMLGLPPIPLGATPTVSGRPVATPSPGVAATPAPAAPDTYVVQPGDTLETVAARLHVDPGVLWWTNRELGDPADWQPGTTLVVPTTHGFLYQVQPGDTLDQLSRTFNVPAQDLQSQNGLSAGAALQPGTLLLIPQP